MLAAYNPSTQFMYGFNNRQHTMHSPNSVAPYPSSLPQLDQSGIEVFTSGWQESQPRYGAGAVNGFPNELPKNISQSSVFSPSSQSAGSRGHYTSSSVRSTMQPFQQPDWTSPSLSPQSISHSPALTTTSQQLYQTVEIGPHSSSEWSHWPETNSSTSSTTHWPNNLRVPPFSPQTIDDLLYTSTSNSPAYSVTNDLPLPPLPPLYHHMSPMSSPSPSPPTSSRKLSPNPSVSPTSSRRGSVDASTAPKQCSHCHATSTPLWRREPMTHKPLCNACGLYLQQRHRHRPKELIEADLDESEEEDDINYNGPECSHCHTHRTSVWRRSKTGAQLCNACGVYARLRGKDRPLSLKRKKIKPRTKHASTSRSTS